MGTVAWPGCQVKEGGMVSIKSGLMASRKISVVNGSAGPPEADTTNLLAINGVASSM